MHCHSHQFCPQTTRHSPPMRDLLHLDWWKMCYAKISTVSKKMKWKVNVWGVKRPSQNKSNEIKLAVICWNSQVVHFVPCFHLTHSWLVMPCIRLCAMFHCRSCHFNNSSSTFSQVGSSDYTVVITDLKSLPGFSPSYFGIILEKHSTKRN